METYDKLWSEYDTQLKTVKAARYSLLLEIKDFYESIGKEVPDEVRKELNTSEFKRRRLSNK